MKTTLSILLILISVLSFSQDKKTIKNFVESFVEYRTKDGGFIKKDSDVLIVGMMFRQEFQNYKSLSIWFDSSELLKDFPYKNVYQVKGFKMIVEENELAKNFNGIFKKLPYENQKKKKTDINYDSQTWSFLFNSKNEIELIYGFTANKDLLDFLKLKNFKFAKDFKKNMGID